MSDHHPANLRPHKIHDHLFRKVFGNVDHARGLLHHVVPPILAETVDWTSLRARPTVHPHTRLSEVVSDVVFVARAKASEAEILFECLYLMEHQCTPDTRMAFRFWNYGAAAVGRYLDDHPKAAFPKVVPILFYQHHAAWTRPRPPRPGPCL